MLEEQSLIGVLLKIKRKKQNKSQKEVSYGICVPSYLSKIENGTVRADGEIVERLYGRLGISYLGNSQKYTELKKKVEKYFYLLQYRLETGKLYSELLKEDELLSYSDFAVDWLIIKSAEGDDRYKYLKELESKMSLEQRAYYNIINFEGYTDTKQRVEDYKEAAKILNHSYAMTALCYALFL